MPFAHERLDVYQLALEFFDLAAMGAGKFSKGDRRRYNSSAMGSSTESAAMHDVCLRRKLITDGTHRRGKTLLDRIDAIQD